MNRQSGQSPHDGAPSADIEAAPAAKDAVVSEGATTSDTLIPGIPLRVHLLGAGGAGLSGAARLLVARGHEVSGYDRAPGAFTRGLEEIGVQLNLGESVEEHLPSGTQLLVHSAALPESDPQLSLARTRGIEILKYSQLLGRLSPAGRTMAVAGTHGKTTTSWMLYHALRGVAEAAGRTAPQPGALIGGSERQLGINSVPVEAGGWFAVEACEYDRSFLHLAPQGAVITNVEPDHLDYYGSFEAVQQAFARFADRVHGEGLIVMGADVPECIEAAAPCRVWRLGRELNIDLIGEQRGVFRFRLRGPGWATPELSLRVPGVFNVENAALAIGLAVGLGAHAWCLDPEEAAVCAARALARFSGVDRRYESWGQVAGIDVVHDYAHHPTEVRHVLEAARRSLPGKPLHVLFQPHQQSRTLRFMDDFVEALRAVDRVVIANVYGARKPTEGEPQREAKGGLAGELVMRLKRAGVQAEEGGAIHEAARLFIDGLSEQCAALILGAGDIDGIKDELLDYLAVRCASPRGTRR